MTQELLLWMLGHLIVFGGSGVAAYIALVQRVTKVETFISLLGTKAARALHSPDDHLGLDKYLDEYLSRHYEMSVQSWKELHDRCEVIIEDKAVKPSERSLAAILCAVCEHKLQVRNYYVRACDDPEKGSEDIVSKAKEQ